MEIDQAGPQRIVIAQAGPQGMKRTAQRRYKMRHVEQFTIGFGQRRRGLLQADCSLPNAQHQPDHPLAHVQEWPAQGAYWGIGADS